MLFFCYKMIVSRVVDFVSYKWLQGLFALWAAGKLGSHFKDMGLWISDYPVYQFHCVTGQFLFYLTTPPDNKGVPPQAAGGDPKVGRPAEPNRTHTLPTDPSSSKATCDTRGLDQEQLQELDRVFGSGHLLHRDLLQHPRRWSNRTITATGSKSQPLLAFVLKEVLSSVVVIFYTHKKRLRQVVMTTSRSCSKAKPH
ncbi:hypothetical protein BHE74_00022856 [Ensete ventricosum]|nr:hypothetical protein BHE74_00022856 [Ensete ventricosum]